MKTDTTFRTGFIDFRQFPITAYWNRIQISLMALRTFGSQNRLNCTFITHYLMAIEIEILIKGPTTYELGYQ